MSSYFYSVYFGLVTSTALWYVSREDSFMPILENRYFEERKRGFSLGIKLSSRDSRPVSFMDVHFFKVLRCFFLYINFFLIPPLLSVDVIIHSFRAHSKDDI